MTQEQIIARVMEMVKAGRSFMLATVDSQNRPQMRWMGAVVLDETEPRVCYMASAANARKVQQISVNPHVQLIFSNESYTCVATVSGTAAIENSLALKQRVWAQVPVLNQYFKSADDPNFGLLKITADRIELLCMDAGHEPAVVEF